jgi:hypothetical protein
VTAIPLSQAVLCGDCDCISDSTGHTCPVCQSTALVSLAVHIEPLPPIEERHTPAEEHHELPQQLYGLVR